METHQTKDIGTVISTAPGTHDRVTTDNPDTNPVATEFEWDHYQYLSELLEEWDGHVVWCHRCNLLNVEVEIDGLYELILPYCTLTSDDLEEIAKRFILGKPLKLKIRRTDG